MRYARLLVVLLAGCAGLAGASDRPYEFGVFPYLPMAKIQELYAPMRADFEVKLAWSVRLSSKSEYAAFVEELRRQTYDIAFVQPFDYVDAHDKHGYLPLARRGEPLEALIVVRQDSPLKSLNDLKGKSIAMPPPDAAVSHMTSMALQRAGIQPGSSVRFDHVRNHFACLQSALIGSADACGTSDQAMLHFEKQKQITSRLRVLHRTAPLPHALFVAHRRVDTRHREILQATILNWPRTEEGRRIIQTGQFIPFAAANDADYDVVRRYLRNRK